MTSPLPRAEQATTPATPRDHLRAFVKLWLHNAACGQALPPTIMARLDLLIDAVEDAARADACQFHSPTGSPCDCGHAGGDDCHPNPNGVTR